MLTRFGVVPYPRRALSSQSMLNSLIHGPLWSQCERPQKPAIASACARFAANCDKRNGKVRNHLPADQDSV